MNQITNIVANELNRSYNRGGRGNGQEEQTSDGNVVKISSQSANIWYTVSIVNRLIFNPPDPARSVPKDAILSFTRNSTILNKPDKFRVCVSRLSIPSSSIPLFLYPQQPEAYTVTLSYVPEDPLQPVIQETVNVAYVQDNVGDAYEGMRPVYYIQSMLNFVNTAFREAFDNIVVAVADIGEQYAPTSPPYIKYDSETKLLSLYAWGSYPPAPATPVGYANTQRYGIFMNKPVFDNFFSGFFSREVLTGNGQFNGIQLLTQDYGDNVVEISEQYYVVMREEFSSAPLFNKVDRVIVSSGMIPTTGQVLATSQQQSIPVLLDFILPDINLDRRRFEYTPFIYRWFDLAQTHPLKAFDLSFRILFETGELVLLKINGGQRVDCTLLFTPKDCCYQ